MTALPCSSCLTPLGPGAERCASCGALRPEPAAGDAPTGPGETLEVCAGCGVVALPASARCEVCDHEHASPRPRAPRLLEGRLFWVAVRARFECRACGHLTPLNHLDMDGSALCVACGTDQAFKARGWERPLKHAHGVGDLSGPGGEGRFPDPALSIANHNAMAHVGVTAVSAVSGRQGRTVGGGAHESLELEAAPGHPLCERCRRPLVVGARTPELITLRCAFCKESERSHPIPPGARDRIAGVAAAEDARGRKDIELLADASGATAVRCPNCSAPLDLSGVCSVVTCSFCSVTSRLPSEVLFRLGFKSVKPLVWWLLFDGPSSRRTEANQLAQRDRKLAAREHQRKNAPAPQPGAAQVAALRPKPWVTLAIVGVALLALVGIVLTATGRF